MENISLECVSVYLHMVVTITFPDNKYCIGLLPGYGGNILHLYPFIISASVMYLFKRLSIWATSSPSLGILLIQ